MDSSDDELAVQDSKNGMQFHQMSRNETVLDEPKRKKTRPKNDQHKETSTSTGYVFKLLFSSLMQEHIQ